MKIQLLGSVAKLASYTTIHASEDQIQSFFHKLSKDKCKSFVLPVTEPFSKEFACLFSGQECYKEAIAESFLNGRVTPQMVINLTQLTHGKSRMWIGTRPVKSQLLGLDRFFTLIPINHCYPCLLYTKQKHLGCKKGEANQKQQLSDYRCIRT